GVTDLTETYPVHKPLIINKKSIRDDHPSRVPLAVPDILAESSNRGTSFLAMRAGIPAQKAFLDELGLFARVPYELAESARPQIQDRWIDLTSATVSYGHGLSVTPLAFTAASAALLNGGYYVKPTITLRDAVNPIERRRVMRAETSETVQDLMRYVVTNGTGRNARAKGYRVMGKTGTADKPGKGGYTDGERVTSFVAGFPHGAPQYIVMVTYDEPQPVEGDYGFASAGWNAAKSTKEIITRIGPILGVKRRVPSVAQNSYGEKEGTL
ncbi:MAG: penicillin-binding transpeptidase domain-containing protein, partial [Maricaulaceae bacterium]